MVEAIAAGLGYTLRMLAILLRSLPGVAGPIGLVFGIWLFDYRMAIIVGSLILIVADLRIGLLRTKPEADK